MPPSQWMPVCPRPLVSTSGQPLPPSLQKEFFQDDVFPDTAVSWEPVLSAGAWLGGANGQPRLLSLQPPDMTPGRMRDWAGGAGRKQGSGWGLEKGAEGPSPNLHPCWQSENSSAPRDGVVALRTWSLSPWRAGPRVCVSNTSPPPPTHMRTCTRPGAEGRPCEPKCHLWTLCHGIP